MRGAESTYTNHVRRQSSASKREFFRVLVCSKPPPSAFNSTLTFFYHSTQHFRNTPTYKARRIHAKTKRWKCGRVAQFPCPCSKLSLLPTAYQTSSVVPPWSSQIHPSNIQDSNTLAALEAPITKTHPVPPPPCQNPNIHSHLHGWGQFPRAHVQATEGFLYEPMSSRLALLSAGVSLDPQRSSLSCRSSDHCPCGLP